MIGIMYKIGNYTCINNRSIRLVNEYIIYLAVDIAEGHWINETMLEYSGYLGLNHNISFYHQFPRSPKTNILGLCAWITVQPKVKKYHHHNVKQNNVLSQSINNPWCNAESQRLTKICSRFLKFLDISIHY